MFTNELPPKSSDYEKAISQLGNKLSDLDRQILAIQFSFSERTISSQRLRDALGYSGIAASNGAYGRLGHLIADAVGFATSDSNKKRKRWWKSLSTGDDSGEQFVWSMRPQLADALMATGLVDPNIDGAVGMPDPDIPGDTSFQEGRLLLRSHLSRERSPALVVAKKRSVGTLHCEVCAFSSLEVYGIDYCEVHHLIPLAKLEGRTPTTLEDLAILCANCHRIIHLSNPPLTLEQLRNKLAEAGPISRLPSPKPEA